MAAEKDFPLSITLRTVDKATSGLKRINDQLEKARKPFAKLGEEFGRFHEHLGVEKISSGLGRIGGQVRSIASTMGVIGAAGAGAVFGFKRLADEFDELGDKAEAMGISVDALAQLRYAAGQSGGEVEELDSSMEAFNKNVGMAKANTGRFAGLLKKVSPALLKQIKGAKGSEEAFGILADAMTKLEDPTKRAALAAAAGFGPSLIPLLARGSDGIKQLRDEFAKNAGSQQGAADAAGKVDEAWRKMGSSIAGVKAAILVGLGPAFEGLVQKATAFFTANREKIAAWAADFGEKLPARIAKLVEAFQGIWNAVVAIANAVGWFVDKVGGAENAVKLLVGAWVAFQAMKIGVGLFEITQGLVKMAGAARAAAAAQGALGGAMRGAGLLGKVGLVGAAGAAGWAAGSWLDDKFGISDKIAGVGDSRDPIHEKYKRMARARANLNVQPPTSKASEAHVTVDFKNAPPGTRVNTAPRSTADIDTRVGYQMVPGI